MIVYPRLMPPGGDREIDFEPQRVDFAAPEAGGYMGGVQAGFPLWLGTWTLGSMTEDHSNAWRAWYVSLRGQQRRFLGADRSRPYPYRHARGFAGMTRAGGGAFDGSATGWSQAIDGAGDARITLFGLPAGLILSLNDYVGFRWDAGGAAAGTYGRRTLARVTEAGVANGAGTIVVTAEPPLPYFTPARAQAHLDEPACVMTMMTDSSKLGSVKLDRTIDGGTIVGLQDLRP